MAANEANAASGALSGAAAGTQIGGPGWGTAIGGAIGLAGSLLGGNATSAAQDAANKAMQERQRMIDAIPLPDIEKMKLQLALQQSAGTHNPIQEQLQQLKGNYYSGVAADPAMVSQQQQYLKTLQQVAQKSETPIEAAQRHQLMNELASQSQSKIQDIQRDQAQRGMASSGGSMLAKLVAQQQAQNASANQADQLQARMYARSLAAGGQASNLANQLDTQQYNRAVGAGERQQAIDTFNTNMSANTQQRNVAGQNAAQAANLANQQNIANSNVATSNQQQMSNKGLLQQEYTNKLAKYGMGNSLNQPIYAGTVAAGENAGKRINAIGTAGAQLADKLSPYFQSTPEETAAKANQSRINSNVNDLTSGSVQLDDPTK